MKQTEPPALPHWVHEQFHPWINWEICLIRPKFSSYEEDFEASEGDEDDEEQEEVEEEDAAAAPASTADEPIAGNKSPPPLSLPALIFPIMLA